MQMDLQRAFCSKSSSRKEAWQQEETEVQDIGLQELFLKQALECFVTSLKSGVYLDILLDDGSALPTETLLDTQEAKLFLRVNDIQRVVQHG